MSLKRCWQRSRVEIWWKAFLKWWNNLKDDDQVQNWDADAIHYQTRRKWKIIRSNVKLWNSYFCSSQAHLYHSYFILTYEATLCSGNHVTNWTSSTTPTAKSQLYLWFKSLVSVSPYCILQLITFDSLFFIQSYFYSIICSRSQSVTKMLSISISYWFVIQMSWTRLSQSIYILTSQRALSDLHPVTAPFQSIIAINMFI